ncbi:hypothetical protein [Serratia oryzae]|uniref:hypothetical protein n=1 Tax=Serratia oryzae TaxID=2034155 RepID=UPI000F782A3C|nr:hypothetical protein [Serratia oryzae]
MYVIHHSPLDWAKKLLPLLRVLFCVAVLSACDSSTQPVQPTDSSLSAEEKSSESSEESTDDKNKEEDQEEKPGVIRCAP